jgi:hypothetical protein
MEGLIDSRNSELWRTLNNCCQIEIQIGNCTNYDLSSKGELSIIYVPENNYDPAFFTHELLHIYLRTRQVFIGSGITSIKENSLLSKIFSGELIEHIGNCLDHIKMYPLFIEMGYPSEKFTIDFSIDKLNQQEQNLISTFLYCRKPCKKIYNSKVIDFYIGKFFAVIACPNRQFDYSEKLSRLKEIEKDLYLILEKFSNAWINYNIEDRDPLTGGYQIFLYDFINSLEKWALRRKIK